VRAYTISSTRESAWTCIAAVFYYYLRQSPVHQAAAVLFTSINEALVNIIVVLV
jgi:hypothetical protein